jgi:hypothetical protein
VLKRATPVVTRDGVKYVEPRIDEKQYRWWEAKIPDNSPVVSLSKNLRRLGLRHGSTIAFDFRGIKSGESRGQFGRLLSA